MKTEHLREQLRFVQARVKESTEEMERILCRLKYDIDLLFICADSLDELAMEYALKYKLPGE